MILNPPFQISSRLLPAIQVGDAWISIGVGGRNGEGRTEYGCYIDLPDGMGEFLIDDLQSGCQGGDYREGFRSLLAFLGAAAESYNYDGMEGEHSNLFPEVVTKWAASCSDEISMMECEISEMKEDDDE